MVGVCEGGDDSYLQHMMVGVCEGGDDSYLLTQPWCCFTSEDQVWHTIKWAVPKILAVISSLSSIWNVKVCHKENIEGFESRYTDCVHYWIVCSKYVFVGVPTCEIQCRCIFCDFEIMWYKKISVKSHCCMHRIWNNECLRINFIVYLYCVLKACLK